MKLTQPVLVPSTTFVTLFTVPAGHKYELIGWTLTCGTAASANIAGAHLFASSALAVNTNIQTTAAVGNTELVNGLSEVFEPGDSFQVIWAAGTGNGQAYCWYVDVET